MKLSQKIKVLSALGKQLKEPDDDLMLKMEEAYHANRWFTIENISMALQNISEQFLKEEKLLRWTSSYSIGDKPPKKIGLIMAGNIPLVGFHDFLCLVISGHQGKIRLSSKDDVLLPYIMKRINSIDEEILKNISIENQLKGMDAYVATGSDNTSRYFLYYFGKYPHLIRRHRNAVAVLDGTESSQDMKNLGKDIFSFFGLGCRNVSKLFVPRGYDFPFFLESLSAYSNIIQHNKYKNNYDYNRTIFLLNKTPHLANEFLMLIESEKTASPVATLFYEFYDSPQDLMKKLHMHADKIQCIMGKGFIPFGTSQSPELWDYADGADTIKFLTELT